MQLWYSAIWTDSGHKVIKIQSLFFSGIAGVVEAYKMSLSQVVLYGPTNFAPIIHHVAKFAAVAQQEQGAKVWQLKLVS